MRINLFARADRLKEHVGAAEYAAVATTGWTRDKMGQVQSLELEVTKITNDFQKLGNPNLQPRS